MFEAFLIALATAVVIGWLFAAVFSPSAAEIATRVMHAQREAVLVVWRNFESELADARAVPYRGPALPGRAVEDATPPPLHLFHGTARENLAQIATQGLEGRTQGLAYMTSNVEEARGYGVGFGDYVIVRINANEAFQHGVDFARAGGRVFVSHHVHPAFVDLAWTLAEYERRTRRGPNRP